MTLAVVHNKTLVAPDTGTEDKVYGVDYVSPTSHNLTGVASVAQGGTGLTSGTVGGLLYWANTNVIGDTGTYPVDAFLVGAGLNAPPSYSSSGTGVLSALGVNVGTAGSVVVNGGVLGTPLSGNLVNCTGYTISLTSGTTAVASGANYAVLREDGSANLIANSSLLFGGAAAGTGLSIAAGTAVTDVAALSITRTNNNAAVATGVKFLFTDTVIADNANYLSVMGGSSATNNMFTVQRVANGSTAAAVLVGTGAAGVNVAGYSNVSISGSAGTYAQFQSNGTNKGYVGFELGGGTADEMAIGTSTGNAKPLKFVTANLEQARILHTASATRYLTLTGSNGADPVVSVSAGNLALAPATNQVVFSAASGSGTVTSRAEINKNVTAIANNTATATLTVTIPNGAHSAGGRITFKGAAGAGGAIGADEFTALVEYDWTVTRTTGVNAVATLSAALLTAITSSVAGGATPTISAALSAISGAVGATNTFTFNVTINALTGSSTNHTCFCYATLINDNASGVTIA